MWCSACLIMKKIWKQLSLEYPDLKITIYDYDFDEEAKQYEVGNILPLVIIKNDNEEVRLVGEKTKQEIIEAIEKVIK